MKNAMFCIPYGLYVVTSNVGGRDNGCVSNTLEQVTSSPNQVSVCLNKLNLTTEMIQSSGVFTASILSEKADFDLIRRFGFQSGRDVDKFEGFSGFKRLDNGTVAVTSGTNSYISVRVTQTVDLGTHLLFIGEVTEMAVLTDVASLTYSYYQEHIKPRPEEAAGKASGQTAWRCRICGYVYEGEDLPADFICPVCKHPASDFEKIRI